MWGLVAWVRGDPPLAIATLLTAVGVALIIYAALGTF